MREQGLSKEEAVANLREYGLNQLPSKSTYSAFKLVLNQFKSPLALLLIVASLISFLVGDSLDGFLIIIIVILNVALGFWQEYKASKELEALRQLEVLESRVIRDGQQIQISSYQIVPGDIVVLESGDKIPADGLLIESYDLQVNESSLTGESVPVTKSIISPDNELFFGTSVTSGRAILKVTKTGVNTKFGSIAMTLSEVKEEPTPLEMSLNSLSKRVGLIVGLVVITLLVIRIFQGENFSEVFLSSIALLVAGVPEGLPTVITVLLSMGVRNMYKRKALVRQLSSIESLGSTNVICTDKTGTLTRNEMRVTKNDIAKSDLKETIHASVVCNSAVLIEKEGQDGFEVLGDTTEGALLFWAKDQGFDIDLIRSEGKVLEELTFDLKRRMMSVLWEDHKTKKVAQYTKGSPESILVLCKLSEAKVESLTKTYKEMAEKGLRVLGIAKRNISNQKKIVEKDMQFLGFVGIADAPRLEAKEAIERAHLAGIDVVMITGDNELTAKYIAEQISLLKDGDEILTGAQLEELSDEEFKSRITKIKVFARVLPEHKLRIVKTFQSIGKVVAVTGDGVNDALALKQAHVGVAMGITGTDVAKESADIVILDDNFVTIIAAVSEGRLIYNNIVKVVKFLMAGNLSELLVIIGVLLLGLPSPLLPAQLLWINLVTDGLPALSLAYDKGDKGTMDIPPRNHKESILNFKNTKYIFVAGSLIALFNIAVFVSGYNYYGLEVARNFVFNSLVFSQMVFIFILRGRSTLYTNKYLIYSVALVLVLQILITFAGPLRQVFNL